MINDISISSPSAGVLRIEGVSDSDEIAYLIQDSPGSTPDNDTEPTGTASVVPGEHFTINVETEPGDKRVWVGVDPETVFDVYVDSESGSDANDGLVPSRSVATIEKAADLAPLTLAESRDFVAGVNGPWFGKDQVVWGSH